MVIQAILVGLVYWLSMGRACYYISFAIRKPLVSRGDHRIDLQ